MTLDELQRIKQWHVDHRSDHPVEYHLWDAMLTLWLMGWVGWLPAFAFEAIEGGVERGHVEGQASAGALLDAFGEVVAVPRALLEEGEDQGFRAAFLELGEDVGSHICARSIYASHDSCKGPRDSRRKARHATAVREDHDDHGAAAPQQKDGQRIALFPRFT